MRQLIAALSILIVSCASPVPSPSATAARTPIGTFAMDRAVGGTCVAVRVDAGTLQTGVANAWWWNQGSSGDCSSRSSDVVSATAGVAIARALTEFTVSIPEMGGTSEDMRIAVEPSPDGLTGTITTKTTTTAVRLVPVAIIDPTFQPVH